MTGGYPCYAIFSRMMVLTANRIAKAIVQRLRLRSTSEPPPSGPCPLPTPKAPDSPASFPECMRIRKIRTTQITTWRTERISSIAVDGTGPSAPRPPYLLEVPPGGLCLGARAVVGALVAVVAGIAAVGAVGLAEAAVLVVAVLVVPVPVVAV